MTLNVIGMTWKSSTNSVCVGCLIEVVGRKFKVNLICLSFEGLDVILRMEWLSNNHVVIECERHNVVFPEVEWLALIFTREALKEMTKGATCFMIVVQVEKKSTVDQIQSIPVVEEYADVFPNEVPKLPSSKDIDFTINLIPRAKSISVTPFRMASRKLAEWKKHKIF